MSAPLEIGVMFWAGGDPLETIQTIKRDYGVRIGQLGIRGHYPIEGAAQAWSRALEQEDFTVVTVFCAYDGESYADVPTVQNTVGFIPLATRSEREQRTKDVSDFAAAIGVMSIATHIGFVPHTAEDPNYGAVLETVQRICDHCAQHGQTFCLETGQEPADTLLCFLVAAERPNLGINFDPANMILYGTGDPIQAVAILSPHMKSVHAKDGVWPSKAGALGIEKPLGQGAVNIDQFIAKLKALGYQGSIHVEHEIENQEQKVADIRAAINLLKRLRSET